ncbi:hypothetical protein PI86_03700 [Burkholderia sp. A9]|uniref:hypothetical protein n=1 Tax=Burkholderia sp. A9 TaxID=1365108 RepID=UPI0005739729|nr:hypothetical protein [Burkholderia sp. A9]KHK60406.1 hypothetical protein PI86_03700 [Burkholderia sp. A9]
MRELNLTEHADVSGGLTSRDVQDWISNILRPKPPGDYVNPFPSDSANMNVVETIGKFVVAAALTGIAVMFRFAMRR